VGGVKAYKLARDGENVELKTARVKIFDIQLIGSRSPTYRFKIHCSSGTYIRSICRDLAYSLGSLATMTAIKRTRAGKYRVEDSVTLQQLENLGEQALESVEDALSGLERVDIPLEYKRPLDNGVRFRLDSAPKQFALYCDKVLYGIAVNDNDGVRVATYLKD
jgi:tRNA pseudouridine55 synthase